MIRVVYMALNGEMGEIRGPKITELWTGPFKTVNFRPETDKGTCRLDKFTLAGKLSKLHDSCNLYGPWGQRVKFENQKSQIYGLDPSKIVNFRPETRKELGLTVLGGR